eukprot:7896676-Ditylum_brightwellii.AAC.1
MEKQKQGTSWQHNRGNKVLYATKRGVATPDMGALCQAKQHDRFCMPFQQAQSEWEQCSQSQMMQWLEPFQPHIKYCTTVHKCQTQNKLRDIRHYFKATKATRLPQLLQQHKRRGQKTKQA